MPYDLFVYGTLRPDRAPTEIAGAVRNLRPLGQGTIRGKLYDLGEYPAVVVKGRNLEMVKGAVFALPDDPNTLAALDEYEEFLPSDPDSSLFVRSKRKVTFPDGSQRLCWVYVYNRKLPKQAERNTASWQLKRRSTPPTPPSPEGAMA